MARTRTGDTPRARQLGAEIKAARKAADFSLRALAEQLGITHTKLANWEAGRQAPDPEDLAALLGVIGVTGTDRDLLLNLARDAADPNWVAPGLDKQLAATIEYDRTAARMFEANLTLVPGLLQTGDYARAIMTGAGATPAQRDQRSLIRLGRQEVLRTGRLGFVAVIGEHALRYPPCDHETMRGQLRHLREMSTLPNVTIGVHPLKQRYSPALEGPFVLYTFDRGRPVVQLEHYRSTTTITDARDVADYQTAADTILRNAMGPDESSGLLAELTDGMERTT